MPGPLEGIKILDFTRWQQGPHATAMLSDMGAEIIKVEERGIGDLGRGLYMSEDGFCAYFEAHNRGKKSITLDVRKEKGKEIVYKLVEQVDVVAENFRKGVMDRLGFSYEKLSQINPKIVYASGSGYGTQGPLTYRPSYDIVGQGMSGLMVAQGGGPGRDPQIMACAPADQVSSMIFAYGIVLGVVARERFGIGQAIDVSLLGSCFTLQPWPIAGYLRSKQLFGGSDRYMRSPAFNIFKCKDEKWVVIAMLDARMWPQYCKAVGREAWTEEYADVRKRTQNHAKLVKELEEQVYPARTQAEWMDHMDKHEIPNGPIYDYEEVASLEQTLANDYVVTLEHPTYGPIREVGIPVKFGKTPGAVQGVAPDLGENTEEILLGLGYDWEQIAELVGEEVI